MEKTYKAEQKFLIGSPIKIRQVVALIKKMTPLEAIEKLPFVQKRAGEALAKVIKSAVANAKAQGANDTDLIFKEIQIGEGPRLKRGIAASRGRWHPLVKKMSHIRVLLTAKSQPVAAKKEDKPAEVKKDKEKNVAKS